MNGVLLSYYKEGLIEAGVDESGRGCLAGPVFSSAVIFEENYHNSYLNDSKKLSKKNRLILRDTIIRDAVAYHVAMVDNEVIDSVNILNATYLSMHMAIRALIVKPEFLIIDGNRFKTDLEIPYECIVKGDSKYLSIAAASILAKTFRDDYMSELALSYPEYGWEKNAGYATKHHVEAIRLHGYTEYHRKSFHLKSDQLRLFE